MRQQEKLDEIIRSRLAHDASIMPGCEGAGNDLMPQLIEELIENGLTDDADRTINDLALSSDAWASVVVPSICDVLGIPYDGTDDKIVPITSKRRDMTEQENLLHGIVADVVSRRLLEIVLEEGWKVMKAR
jgi:hypothetical protein